MAALPDADESPNVDHHFWNRITQTREVVDMATVLCPVELVDESGVCDWSAHEPSDGRAVVPPGSTPTTFTASTSHPDDVRLLGGTGDRPSVRPDESEHPFVLEHPTANPAPALLKRADLDRVRTVFPELLGMIDSLRSLEGEIRDGGRAASAEDTMSALSAIEAMNRVTESIQATLLSRFHREGVPEKYGARSARALLQERLKLSTREANRRDALARNVGERVGLDGGLMEPEYPLLAEALRSSAVSTDQVEAITRSVTKLPPTLRSLHRAAAEKILLESSRDLQVKDIPVLGRRIVDHVDPDGRCPRDETDPEAYHVTVAPLANGDWRLTGLLDAVSGTMLRSLLDERWSTASTDGSGTCTANGGAGTDGGATCTGERGASTNGTGTSIGEGGASTEAGRANRPGWSDRATSSTDPRTGFAPSTAGRIGSPESIATDQTTPLLPDTRPPGVRRHDRFSHLMTRCARDRVAHDGAYAVVVTATAEQLAAGRAEVETQYGTPIRLEDLLRLSAAGKFFYHSMGSRARPARVRTESRFASATQVALLTARDSGCTFPDCDAPPGWCDSHHMIPHARGGPTDLSNLTQVCTFHHHWHERYGWESVMVRGLPAWIPPPDIDPLQHPIHHSKFRAQLDDVQLPLFDADAGPG